MDTQCACLYLDPTSFCKDLECLLRSLNVHDEESLNELREAKHCEKEMKEMFIVVLAGAEALLGAPA